MPQEQALQEEAFAEAVKLAKERFIFECKIIDLDPDTFSIMEWNAKYDGKDRMQSFKGIDFNDGGIEISAGKASVRVSVSLSYEDVKNLTD